MSSTQGPRLSTSRSNALLDAKENTEHATGDIEQVLLTGNLPSPHTFLLQRGQMIKEINDGYRRDLQVLIPWSCHVQDATNQAKACLAKLSKIADVGNLEGLSGYPQLKYFASHMPDSDSCGALVRTFTAIYRDYLVASQSISDSYSQGDSGSPSLRRGWSRQNHDLQNAVRVLGYKVAKLRNISNKLKRAKIGPSALNMSQQVAKPEPDTSQISAINMPCGYWHTDSSGKSRRAFLPDNSIHASSTEQVHEAQALLAYRDPYGLSGGNQDSGSKPEDKSWSQHNVQSRRSRENSLTAGRASKNEKSRPGWSGLRRRLGFGRRSLAQAAAPGGNESPWAIGTDTDQTYEPASPELRPGDSISHSGRHVDSGGHGPEGRVSSNISDVGTGTEISFGPDIELQSQLPPAPVERTQEPTRHVSVGQTQTAATTTRAAVFQATAPTPAPRTWYRKILKLFARLPCLFFVPLTMFFMAMSLTTGIIYSILKDDASGGFTIAAYILAMGAVGLGPGYTSHLSHCVCLDRMKQVL